MTVTTILPKTKPQDNLDAEPETLLDLESEEAIVGKGCPIDPEERDGCEACS